MQELDDDGRRLLSVLVGHISKPGVVPGKPETYITYKEAHRQAGLPCHGEPHHHYGQCLKRSGMDTLGNWAQDMGLPAITGLIVEQGSHEPGEGFFNLYPGTDDPYGWWTDQIRLARTPVDQWTPYLHGSAPQPSSSAATPIAGAGTTATPSTTYPIPPEPKVLNSVYDSLVAAGINVDDWGTNSDGKPIDNPRNNPSRNSAWSYVGKPEEPIALCVWYDMVDWTPLPSAYAGNESEYQLHVRNALTNTADTGKKLRLRRWIDRSDAFSAAVYEAFSKRREVRIILLAGKRITPEESVDEHTGVYARELDPAPWYVHSKNGVTGDYAIVRGVKPPPQTTPEEPEEGDPLADPNLLDLLATLDDTEAEALIKARTCQGLFRKRQLERWKTCSVSGSSFTGGLIASHIKPWAHCDTKAERVGAANGLLLTPNLDKLFDMGLITFEDNLRIRISPLLQKGWQIQLGVDASMRIRSGHTDILPFLVWHRENRYYETEEQRVARPRKRIQTKPDPKE